MTEIDRTHDAGARSWLASANAAGCEFPVQNLPHGVFRARGGAGPFRGGIAIGDCVLDIGALLSCFEEEGWIAAEAAAEPTLNRLMSLGRDASRRLRARLFDLLVDEQYEARVSRALHRLEHV